MSALENANTQCENHRDYLEKDGGGQSRYDGNVVYIMKRNKSHIQETGEKD